MHPAFEGMRDVANTQHLQAWLQGQTGYPIVDACMRSLQEKGWLNFRMRAMVVSFAAYNLWIDWRVLSPVLAQLFTDYEPGIHYSQLQMQSGVTGINAIRIYNPIKQSLDQDPEANFIRTYVPELSDLPLDLIHTPWAIEPMFQKEYLVRIGRDYPMPIVEGDSSMKKARLELAKVRKSLNFKSISREVFIKHGSRKKSLKKKKSNSPQRDSQSEQMELDFES
jgi:deoxyribodipyrimidine photo-lyase